MRSSDLLPILNEIGEAIGKGKELADSVFENSPFEMLPFNATSEYDPLFGYLSPAMVKEYAGLLNGLPDNLLRTTVTRRDKGMAGGVLYSLKSTFGEAQARGVALAVNHC